MNKLVKRQNKGAPLTATEHDSNMSIIESGLNKISGLEVKSDRYIFSAAITGDKNKLLTLTRADGTKISVSFTDVDTDTNDFVNSLNFDASKGNIVAVFTDGSKSSSVNIDGRYALLDHHHDGQYLKIQSGAVSDEVTFESPVFFEDTIKSENPILLGESLAAMESGPGNNVVSKDFVLSKIPTKTTQLTNDSGFVYESSVPKIEVVTIGGVVTSVSLNATFSTASYPIRTILVNNNPGKEEMYVRITQDKWLKFAGTLI